MNPTVMAAIITALKANATLTGLLGGEYIYPGFLSQAYHVPCLTVHETTESSVKRVGYTRYSHRDSSAVIQVDALVSGGSPDNADAVMVEAEKTLVSDTVTNTHGWEKIGTGPPEYDDLKLAYRVMARFRFEYNLTD